MRHSWPHASPRALPASPPRIHPEGLGEVDVLEMGREEACRLWAEVHFRDCPQRRCDRCVRAT